MSNGEKVGGDTSGYGTAGSVKGIEDGNGKSGRNPLEVSPANKDISQGWDHEDQKGVAKGVDRGASQRVSPRKGKTVNQ